MSTDIQTIDQAAYQSFAVNLIELRKYIEDPDITEIMINSPSSIWIENSRGMERVDHNLGERLDVAINNLGVLTEIAKVKAGTESGMINAKYDKLRIAVVMAPTSADGHSMCIRKHSETVRPIQFYLDSGAFSIEKARPVIHKKAGDTKRIGKGLSGKDLIDFIASELRDKKNFLLAGATSAGKTSLLNAFLSEFIPRHERIITIEDTLELNLSNPNKVRFLSNKSQNVSTQSLIEMCLRYRPDRIILGELRGAEALDFIQALNTGHGGSWATLHAKTAHDALQRIESLYQRGLPTGTQIPQRSVRMDIASSIDYVLHFIKDPDSPFRCLSSMVKVLGIDESGNYLTEELFNIQE